LTRKEIIKVLIEILHCNRGFWWYALYCFSSYWTISNSNECCIDMCLRVQVVCVIIDVSRTLTVEIISVCMNVWVIDMYLCNFCLMGVLKAMVASSLLVNKFSQVKTLFFKAIQQKHSTSKKHSISKEIYATISYHSPDKNKQLLHRHVFNLSTQMIHPKTRQFYILCSSI